jgi:hypothetical protein
MAFLKYSDDIRISITGEPKREATQLLYQMHAELIGTTTFDTLQPAGPKQMLVDYGGTSTIVQFRSECHGNFVMYKPTCKPVSIKIVGT